MLRNAQIRDLCQRLAQSSSEVELAYIASQLQVTIHEHVETLRGNLIVSVLPVKDDPANEAS